MRGEESSGKTPSQSLYSSREKNQDVSTRFGLSLYSSQISKNTKIPSIPIIHEGQNWKKKSQKGSQTRVKRAKIKKMQKHFRTGAKFSHPSAKLSIFQFFLLFFPSGF